MATPMVALQLVLPWSAALALPRVLYEDAFVQQKAACVCYCMCAGTDLYVLLNAATGRRWRTTYSLGSRLSS